MDETNLGELQHRGVKFRTSEAAAIVRAVCDALTSGEATNRHLVVSTLDEISIQRDGSIAIRAPREGDLREQMRQLAGLIEVVLPPFGSREARYAVPTSFRVLPARARGKPGLPPLATVEELASALHAYVDAAPRAVLHGLWQRTRAAAGTVPGEAAIDGGNRLNTPSFFDLPRDDADGIAQFRQEHRPPIDDAERFQFIPAGALRGDPRGARPGSHRRRRRGRTWLTSLALILVGFAIGLAGAQYYLGHGGAEPLLQAIEARAPWVAGAGERWLREVGRVLKVDRREEPRSSETVAPGASSEAPPNHFSQTPAPDPNMPDSGAAPEPAAQPVKTSGTK